MEEWKRLEKINELKDKLASKEDDIGRYCEKIVNLEVEIDKIKEQLDKLEK